MPHPFAIAGMALSLAAGAGRVAAATPEQAFEQANAAVMDRMMAGMSAKPSGEVDADFVNMMEPHHQGAIEMAELELTYGRNAQLRRIAQEIIVEQQQEIAAMRLALGRALPPSTPAPTQGGAPAFDAPRQAAPPHAHAAATLER